MMRSAVTASAGERYVNPHFSLVAAHARLAVSFHTRFVRDKNTCPFPSFFCQMISVHDAERALSDDPDRPDLHS